MIPSPTEQILSLVTCFVIIAWCISAMIWYIKTIILEPYCYIKSKKFLRMNDYTKASYDTQKSFFVTTHYSDDTGWIVKI